MNELELFLQRVERGITDTRDAEWFRHWLAEQPGNRMDLWTVVLAGFAILVLMVLAVAR